MKKATVKRKSYGKTKIAAAKQKRPQQIKKATVK